MTKDNEHDFDDNEFDETDNEYKKWFEDEYPLFVVDDEDEE